MLEFLIVGLGGFIGCCLRFGMTKIMLPLNLQFPIATLISNIIAGFFVGFIIGLEKDTLLVTPKTKLFVITGMMGGLSTFSTFSLETIKLFSQSKFISASGNILLNITLSFIGVLLGMLTAKMLLRKSI
ncbi:MAG: hypothetical protein A2Y15_06215 [Clostridiales bacterium GWF2_36_10]|nr:MAG: hypothetical protein A2Y15_06215 [Clostridiales bacterium GWF2_36_10]HAN21889.1 fluoride efflux transporter CrcB [Clostridiales bacterium]